MICDIVIITSSYLVVHDIEKIFYGYVVLCVQGFCIDQVVNSRRRSVQFFIISQKYEEIGKRINVDAERGVTVVNASGFYSGQDVKMLFVLAKQRQAPIIFRMISEIDPHAFVSQSAVIAYMVMDLMNSNIRQRKSTEFNPCSFCMSNLFPSFFAVSMEFLISRYNILLTVGEANEQIPHPALKSGVGDLACSAELFHLNGLFRSRILSIYNFVWVYQ